MQFDEFASWVRSAAVIAAILHGKREVLTMELATKKNTELDLDDHHSFRYRTWYGNIDNSKLRNSNSFGFQNVAAAAAGGRRASPKELRKSTEHGTLYKRRDYF